MSSLGADNDFGWTPALLSRSLGRTVQLPSCAARVSIVVANHLATLEKSPMKCGVMVVMAFVLALPVFRRAILTPKPG
jgi:hypothetical protein